MRPVASDRIVIAEAQIVLCKNCGLSAHRMSSGNLIRPSRISATTASMCFRRKRSNNGVLDGPIDRGPQGGGGEAFFPQPRRQRGDVAGRVTLDALEHVDQVGVRIDALQAARNEQALEDPDVLRPDFRPAEQPVLSFMESSP